VHPKVRLEAVDGGNRRLDLRLIHPATNEPALTVDATVVEPRRWTLLLDRPEPLELLGLEVEQREPRGEAEYEPAAPVEPDGADALRELVRAQRAGAGGVAPDLAVVDVHPDELAAPPVPYDALAEAVPAVHGEVDACRRARHQRGTTPRW
jgi:hypothetical protein